VHDLTANESPIAYGMLIGGPAYTAKEKLNDYITGLSRPDGPQLPTVPDVEDYFLPLKTSRCSSSAADRCAARVVA
jgi:hypothetical protein